MDAVEGLELAKSRFMEGRLAEAAALCRQLIAAQPDLAEAENLLGLIFVQEGDIDAASAHLRRAVALAPGIAAFHADLGKALHLSGRADLALAAARQALAIEPDMVAALTNMGAAHSSLGNFEEAVAAQRRAIARSPGSFQSYTNLGNALTKLHRFAEAIAAHRRAIELNPRAANAWACLATTLNVSGAVGDDAIAARRAIALSPDHAGAHVSLACVLLARGDFREGWEEYEWRLRLNRFPRPRIPERPWRGESLAGRHVCVEAEQGYGDTLQFVRYVPLLAARAAKVTLRVPQPLAALMRASLPGVEVLAGRDDPASYDNDVALLSLPRLFKTRVETIPANVPYLRPPAETALRWRLRLAGMSGLKIGIAWAGNQSAGNDIRRSVELRALTPLLTVAGASFASLQYGPRAVDLRQINSGRVIEDLSADVGDFGDAAGAISALDLVISVDTSVAHLASALGKPTWVLTPRIGDWRWMSERPDSPWYPTMRLYRQNRDETWDAVVARMARDLDILARGDLAPLTPFKAIGERRAAQAAAIIAIEAERALAP